MIRIKDFTKTNKYRNIKKKYSKLPEMASIFELIETLEHQVVQLTLELTKEEENVSAEEES